MTALFILTVQAEPFGENSSQISCLALAFGHWEWG